MFFCHFFSKPPCTLHSSTVNTNPREYHIQTVSLNSNTSHPQQHLNSPPQNPHNSISSPVKHSQNSHVTQNSQITQNFQTNISNQQIIPTSSIPGCIPTSNLSNPLQNQQNQQNNNNSFQPTAGGGMPNPYGHYQQAAYHQELQKMHYQRFLMNQNVQGQNYYRL